jgi:hypothetical protein
MSPRSCWIHNFRIFQATGLHASITLTLSTVSFLYVLWFTLDQRQNEALLELTLNSSNACYHSVQNLFSSRLQSKNVKTESNKRKNLACCPVWVQNLVSDVREEHRLRVFESSVLRWIFGFEECEVTGGWRKLHNEVLHKLHYSPRIIRMIKSRMMRWAWYVTRMGRRAMYRGYLQEIQEEIDH